MALVATFLSASVYAAPSTELSINYLDGEDVGVNEKTEITLSTGESVIVGEKRKVIIERAVRALSLQFEYDNSPSWNVAFQNNEGYNGVTFGPSFITHNADRTSDYFGLLEDGRSYPSILYTNMTDYVEYDPTIASTELSSSTAYLDPFLDDFAKLDAVVTHELLHVLGFSAMECLGECYPERSSVTTPMSLALRYNSESLLKEYESLTLDEKEEAGLSHDKLLFAGSDDTYIAVTQTLTAGHTDGLLQMYADAENGKWSGQAASHFSQDIQPAQLMSAYGASTVESGMAAYVMCDLGWCREQGKVTALSIYAEPLDNLETDDSVTFEIGLSNGLNNVVENVFAQIRIPDGQTLTSFEGDGLCSLTSDAVLDCETSLSELDQQTISVTLAKTDDNVYALDGELWSKGYNVDSNGFDNILDTTFDFTPEPVDTVEPEPTDPVEPEPTDPAEPEPTDPEPTDPVDTEPVDTVEPEPTETVDQDEEETEVDSDSSGGALAWGLLPLVLLAIRRRIQA